MFGNLSVPLKVLGLYFLTFLVVVFVGKITGLTTLYYAAVAPHWAVQLGLILTLYLLPAIVAGALLHRVSKVFPNQEMRITLYLFLSGAGLVSTLLLEAHEVSAQIHAILQGGGIMQWFPALLTLCATGLAFSTTFAIVGLLLGLRFTRRKFASTAQ
ncbi:hypothetical protein [Brucella intermedia]|uniref:hypothetical protein n=1 Tax=Brucella intermedia TaxID=94625 RepID=UPI00124E31B3|nr:hypothetical protein [Brucella intermedia]KAB2697483.1 hypothetical protein F9K72_05005 [Brucella intermedia]